MGESRLVTLSCPGCAGTLNVGPAHDLFACGYCGANVRVERSGGTISLSQVTEAMSRLARGADKTHAELALPRLTEELRVAEGRLAAFKSHAQGLEARYDAQIAHAGKRDGGDWIIFAVFAAIAFVVVYAGVGVPYMLLHRGPDPIPEWYLAIMAAAGLAAAVGIVRKSIRLRAGQRERKVRQLGHQKKIDLENTSKAGPELEAHAAKLRARVAEARRILGS